MCSLFVDCCVLLGGGCLLFVVCSLFVVRSNSCCSFVLVPLSCCLLFVVGCLWFVVSCLSASLFVVGRLL